MKLIPKLEHVQCAAGFVYFVDVVVIFHWMISIDQVVIKIVIKIPREGLLQAPLAAESRPLERRAFSVMAPQLWNLFPRKACLASSSGGV